MAVDELAPVAAPPASVLRTFLTADVRGYTRFTQEFGDEAAARLATKFAAVTRDVVAVFGGGVVDLRGDEAMCVFASARQALRSALALQKRFAEETEQNADLPLRVGIGLDAGEVVPVEGGFRGGALNLASRLSSLAGAGEVLASDVAMQLARRTKGLAYVERGLVDLKGFADPVRVVRVVDENDLNGDLVAITASDEVEAGETNGHDHEEHGSLPIGGFLGALPEGLLVAREREFDEILASIQSVERCAGRLVLLSGEPGVGKTRLAQEVTLKARNHGFIMATGRCYEPEATVPFYPFLEALATLCTLVPEPIRNAIPERWPQVQRLLPTKISGRQSPLSEGGQEEQQRLFWAVTGFLQAIAQERPLALLLDDLHWADASSLELLQHLARHTRGNRILLLGTYRDVEVNRQHPLESALTDLGRERLLDEIEVRRLDKEGTAELVACTLGGEAVASEFVTLVHKQTEGNPFFVEEVVRTLVDRGDVYLKDGRWEGRSVEELEVPKSVRSVVGQRLARLSSESQEVLREASVLGPAFTFPDLLLMCERPEPELEGAIEEALTSGLLRETGRDTYAFNHALTQGTLYSELSSRKRRRLHLAAGQALEQLPEHERDKRIPELAWHFLEADDPEPALRWALRAGRAARELFAYDEAERHYRTALELARELHDLEAEVRSLEELGRILRTIARYDEALEILDRAVEIHRDMDDAPGERWATAHIGRVHALRGTAQQGIERLNELVAAVEAASQDGIPADGSTAGLGALYTALADLYQATNNSEAQLAAAEKALEVARLTQDPKGVSRIQVESQMWRASALAELGELNDARKMLEDVIPLAEKTGDALILSRALNSLATIYSEAGQYDREQAYIERALHAAEKSGDPTRTAYMNHRLGWHLFMRGNVVEAEKYFICADEMWRSLGWTRLAPWTLVGEAAIALLKGDEQLADSLFSHARELARRPGQSHFQPAVLYFSIDRFVRRDDVDGAVQFVDSVDDWPAEDDMMHAYVLSLRAWVEFKRGNLDLARDMADQATELASADQNRTILIDSLRVQGILLAADGDVEGARQAFDESIAIARTIEQPYGEARSLEAKSRALAEHDLLDEANEIMGHAAGIYGRIGATADASRAASAMPRVSPSLPASA